MFLPLRADANGLSFQSMEISIEEGIASRVDEDCWITGGGSLTEKCEINYALSDQ